MLELLQLYIKAAGRLVEEQVIDFTTLGKLVQLDGKNMNTGFSSGAGKSTVFNALDFLLGLNKTPNSVLQSRLTKDPMTVVGIFRIGGIPVTIKRGKKLSVQIGDTLIEGSNALAEEEIDKILGMPRELFRKMLHKRQKEGGFFMQFTPKETYEFLLSCLGQSDLKGKTDKVDKRTKDLELALLTARSTLQQTQSAVSATNSAFEGLGVAPIKTVSQEAILALKQAKEKAQIALDTQMSINYMDKEALALRRPTITVKPWDQSKKAGLRNDIAELEKKLRTILDIESARQNEIKQKISEIRVQKASLQGAVNRGPAALVEAQRIAMKIKLIQAAQCHTCSQAWANEASKAEEASLIAQVQKLGLEVKAGKDAENAMLELDNQTIFLASELETRFDPLAITFNEQIQSKQMELGVETQSELAHIGTQNVTNQALLKAFAEEESALHTKHIGATSDLQNRVLTAERDLNSSVQRMQSEIQASQRYEQQASHLSSQLSGFHEKIMSQSQLVADLEAEFALATEAKKAIKSFASCSFDDALETIGQSATRIIRNIPVMRDATIQLEGLKETKEGKVKEEVNAVISMGGEVGIPIKSLCGGESSSVDLAIDLAVVDFLESKSGKGCDLFILDEPFTGMSAGDIEMALEIIKNSNINKRLVIVDHNSEVKQMVESSLVVIREGQTSKIVQSA